jgi:hypothetical protein
MKALLDLSARWRSVVSFTPLPFYLGQVGQVGSRFDLDDLEKPKFFEN